MNRRLHSVVCVLALMAALVAAGAQAQKPHADSLQSAAVQGYVRDSDVRPVANATVSLQLATDAPNPPAQAQTTHTDSNGAYRFTALRAGSYTLRAEMKGYSAAIAGPVSLAQKATAKIDLTLGPLTTPRPTAQAPALYDEPQFTVAGVTSASNSSGHSSDIAIRTTEALARATATLSDNTGSNQVDAEAPSAATESSLRDAVARDPNDGALHHRLADIEEKRVDPLAAAREYQRAAELDPSEPNVFDWGAELLTHRALEPATEVFTNGNRLFPQSVRMLVALGVAWYARGSYDQAAECLVKASDLAPSDPTPYVFMGKMESAGLLPWKETLERLERFHRLQPDNALANYYYGAALWKSKEGADASAGAVNEQVETLLQKAVRIDPKLGAAYLQLGVLYAQRGDYARAIAAYLKAIAASPELAEAHYRLALAYERTGDEADAKKQLQIHAQLSKLAKEDSERERQEIQEFVISLRSN